MSTRLREVGERSETDGSSPATDPSGFITTGTTGGDIATVGVLGTGGGILGYGIATELGRAIGSINPAGSLGGSVGLTGLGVLHSLSLTPGGPPPNTSYGVPTPSAAPTSSLTKANGMGDTTTAGKVPGPPVQQSMPPGFGPRLGANPAKGAKTVGRIIELGVLGRIKRLLGGGDRVGKAARTLARQGSDDLVRAVKQGDDVIVDSPQIAKDIARRAGGGKAPELHKVTDEQLEQGFLPHYHPEGSDSHVFFEPAARFGLKDVLEIVIPGPTLIFPLERILPFPPGPPAVPINP